jgi:polyisoprenoid-binding protein YceI
MKTSFIVFAFVLITSSSSGQKFVMKSGTIKFVSKAQLELIQAASDKLQGILDPSNNQFAFLIDMRSFQGFNSGLQRQHFNENYIESEKFPLARFSGKVIEQIDYAQNGVSEVRAKGELDIHGQKQVRIIKVKITVNGNQISIEAQFLIPLSDHNITIPKIVNQKIATEIEVGVNATLIRE